MNGTINTPSTHQPGVGGINYSIGSLPGNISLDNG
jgi:hypothetical protein